MSVAASVAAWTTSCVFGRSQTWPTVRRGSPSLSLWNETLIVLLHWSERFRCRFHSLCHLHRHVTTRTRTVNSFPSWVMAAFADDGCALATVGLGRFGTGFEDALTPSPLPACSGAPELTVTTTTSLCSAACLVTVGASVVRQQVCPSWPPPDLNPRVLTPADVESCEPQRCPLSCQ